MALLRAYYQAYQGLPRVAWMLASLLFVSSAGSMVLPFLTIYLSKVQGYTADQAVLFLAIFGAAALLARTWVGG